jgi:hypothetical protein
MGSSDLKFFALIGVVAAVAYGLVFSWDWKKPKSSGASWLHPEPTIQFVPPGTPGAMTMEEFSKRQFERR